MIENALKLPRCVDDFMTELASYVKSDTSIDVYMRTAGPFCIKDGKLIIVLKKEVLTNRYIYDEFQKQFAIVKNSFPTISSYIKFAVNADLIPIEELSKLSPGLKGKPCYRAFGLYVEIAIKELVLNHLEHFFNPETEIDVSSAIELLRKCGMSDSVIMNRLDIPRTTFRRYAKPIETKTVTEESKMAIATIPT